MSNEYFGKHEDGRIIVAAGAVVRDPEGRVLLVRHRPEREGFWKGKWICPGGRLELGETIDEAAKREVMEETGLEIKIVSWLPPFDRLVKKDSRVLMHVIYLDCLANASGKAVPGDDVGEAAWFSIKQITDMLEELHEDTRILLANAKII